MLSDENSVARTRPASSAVAAADSPGPEYWRTLAICIGVSDRRWGHFESVYDNDLREEGRGSPAIRQIN